MKPDLLSSKTWSVAQIRVLQIPPCDLQQLNFLNLDVLSQCGPVYPEVSTQSQPSMTTVLQNSLLR